MAHHGPAPALLRARLQPAQRAARHRAGGLAGRRGRQRPGRARRASRATHRIRLIRQENLA